MDITFLRRVAWWAAILVVTLLLAPQTLAQQTTKTLAAVWAHADDEAAAAPVLARYAREGVRVYMIIVTDGSQGGRSTSISRGPELARVRVEEARCAAAALGSQPPILLAFPDAQLGSYMEDPARLFEVTARLQSELARLAPDALITWGPDGGTGHPDHRLVSSIVTQLVRAGAPGAPERLFYASLPEEGMRAVNPARGAAPFVIPLAKHFSTRVSYSPEDLDASLGAMTCHKSQYTDEVLGRIVKLMKGHDTGVMAFSAALSSGATDGLFGR
jgi:LmbE family N-acetylglucosaminyl deacetylase